jgi:hypothetical protein
MSAVGRERNVRSWVVRQTLVAQAARGIWRYEDRLLSFDRCCYELGRLAVHIGLDRDQPYRSRLRSVLPLGWDVEQLTSGSEGERTFAAVGYTDPNTSPMKPVHPRIATVAMAGSSHAHAQA